MAATDRTPAITPNLADIEAKSLGIALLAIISAAPASAITAATLARTPIDLNETPIFSIRTDSPPMAVTTPARIAILSDRTATSFGIAAFAKAKATPIAASVPAIPISVMIDLLDIFAMSITLAIVPKITITEIMLVSLLPNSPKSEGTALFVTARAIPIKATDPAISIILKIDD